MQGRLWLNHTTKTANITFYYYFVQGQKVKGYYYLSVLSTLTSRRTGYESSLPIVPGTFRTLPLFTCPSCGVSHLLILIGKTANCLLWAYVIAHSTVLKAVDEFMRMRKITRSVKVALKCLIAVVLVDDDFIFRIELQTLSI